MMDGPGQLGEYPFFEPGFLIAVLLLLAGGWLSVSAILAGAQAAAWSGSADGKGVGVGDEASEHASAWFGQSLGRAILGAAMFAGAAATLLSISKLDAMKPILLTITMAVVVITALVAAIGLARRAWLAAVINLLVVAALAGVAWHEQTRPLHASEEAVAGELAAAAERQAKEAQRERLRAILAQTEQEQERITKARDEAAAYYGKLARDFKASSDAEGRRRLAKTMLAVEGHIEACEQKLKALAGNAAEYRLAIESSAVLDGAGLSLDIERDRATIDAFVNVNSSVEERVATGGIGEAAIDEKLRELGAGP